MFYTRFFKNLTGPVIEGPAQEKSRASISQDGATINGINVSFAKPGDKATVTLYMGYDKNATELPKGDVIMNMNLKFNFVQSN